MALEIEAAEGVGAYVKNIDLTQLDNDSVEQLRAALGEFGVLFFRDQRLTEAQHIELAESFGTININRFFTAIDGYPKIAQVLKDTNHKTNVGSVWHTDHSYDHHPALGSILVARDLPSKGGDTIFRNMSAAYEALPEETKVKIQKLKALHSSRHVFGAFAYSDNDLHGRLGNTAEATQDAIHPVVIQHPISQKPVLYVNPQFTVSIEGLVKSDSDQLLQSLYDHALQAQFEHRFEWREGSVVFWDNRFGWHKALNDYPGERRLMHRITIEGCALEGL